MGFRLCVINPNSDEAVTSHLRDVALGVLPPGSEVEAVTCASSPRVIETSTDDVLASVAVLQAALAASSSDAFFVGCFGDPAISALREVTRAPVVGLGEAALVQARTVTSRFGVLTTLDRGVPSLWSQLERAGAASQCVGIRAVHPPTRLTVADPREEVADPEGETAEPEDDTAEPEGDIVARRLAEQGRELVGSGADGLVLACAAFSPCSAALSLALDIPVCDGVALGACISYGLWASGVWTSKSGAYAWSDAAWASPNPS
ncbi:MAG TPA: aspartate/glutamate racemase family protein [Acidimicrobiales bacterium]|nr:aspartate/glutamate racemase family protein [Acidimicrobiales bacterium]